MKWIELPFVLGTALVVLSACDNAPRPVAEKSAGGPVSGTRTFETAGLDQAIAAYRSQPTEQSRAAVDKAFAELDGEIAELKQKAASASGDQKVEIQRKLADLEAYRANQHANYAGERAESAAESAKDAVKDAAKEVGGAIESAGEAIRKVVD
jgi:hypothetical protein